MFLSMIIELLSLALALTGLLLQTRRDHSMVSSWYNLSRGGRFVLVLLVLVASTKIVKGQMDVAAQSRASLANEMRLVQLQTSNNDLITTNQHLIKVMSVASGYNALLSGIVVFRQTPTDKQVQEALRNLFLKYAEVDITATNRLGVYSGRVDYGVHPEVLRYLNLIHVKDDPYLVNLRARVADYLQGRAFFYEIRCANLKILNKDKIQYARFDPDERIHASAKVFDWWQDFRSLYAVQSLYVDKLTIEELGEVPIDREF